jgi:hypothetical protein
MHLVIVYHYVSLDIKKINENFFIFDENIDPKRRKKN